MFSLSRNWWNTYPNSVLVNFKSCENNSFFIVNNYSDFYAVGFGFIVSETFIFNFEIYGLFKWIIKECEAEYSLLLHPHYKYRQF